MLTQMACVLSRLKKVNKNIKKASSKPFPSINYDKDNVYTIDIFIHINDLSENNFIKIGFLLKL